MTLNFTNYNKSKLYITVLFEINIDTNTIIFNRKDTFFFVAQHSGNSRNNHNNHNLVVVPESARCRRTDGKNWRCTKITLQGQKYCAQHMHRGVKKVQNYQNSNTSLSFSVGASYVQKGSSVNQSNESSDSDDDDGRDPNGANNSSSSDATTISM